MSTNYYVAWPGGLEADGAVYRNEIVLHIGKTNSGNTSLQGHPTRGWSARPYDWPEILSWRDWLHTFDVRPGWVIYDEYQSVMTLSELRSRIERSTVQERRAQYEWVRKNWHNSFENGLYEYWLDVDGYTLSWREFS